VEESLQMNVDTRGGGVLAPHRDGGIYVSICRERVIVAVAMAGLLLALPGAAFAVEEPGMGSLKVKTIPEVRTIVSVDGVPMDGWGLKKVLVETGEHTVSFSDVPGYITPDPASVMILEGETTTLVSSFVELGLLQVVCEPAVKSTIFVDGVAIDDYGAWTYVMPGVHEVSFGPVAGYDPPEPMAVRVRAGYSALVTGEFTPNPDAMAPSGFGCLRVESSPALPSTIYIDGVPRDCWGLSWLKLLPGCYEVSFSDVPRFITPEPMMVEVVEGGVATVTGSFIAEGGLRVVTTPPSSATVYVDGIARDSWGIWLDLPAGEYLVSFGDVPGHTAPEAQTVQVVPGQTTLVVGEY